MAEIKREKFKLPHPGPYIAKITNYADPTYMGAFEAVLEQGLGTQFQELRNHAVLIYYSPPFAGSTSADFEGNEDSKFDDVQKSYGMWMVPPDLYSRVLCMFVESDPQQGYWIGCVQDRWQNHMVPGIASSSNVAWAPGQKDLYGNMPVPVAEFRKKGKTISDPSKQPKPVHPFADRLLKQGLLSDKYRGVTTSSARREIPSAVFGISTPGPIDKNGPKKEVGYASKKAVVPISRTGGHSFVMDDGDLLGENQLVRIRSSTGHQILMNDTANLIYIANADGTAWIEMTASGKIDVYAKDSISIHSEQDFNFRAGRDINLEAIRNVNIKSFKDTVFNVDGEFNLLVSKDGKVRIGGKYEHYARTDLNISASGSANIYSGAEANITAAKGINLVSSDIKTTPGIKQNTQATQATVATDALNKIAKLALYSVPATSTERATWKDRYQAGTVPSTLQRVPMHEPWLQHESYSPNKFTSENTDVSCVRTPGSQPPAAAPAPVRNSASPADWTKDQDWLDLVQVLCTDLNCGFYDMLAIMYLETDKTMDPSKRNPTPGATATGLIQFLESTAKNLGTTTDKLGAMTRVDQMAYVEKYFNQSGIKKVAAPGISDLYMAVFAPIGIGKPADYVLYSLEKTPKAYKDNKIYDTDNNGTITKAEASAMLPTFKKLVMQKMGV
jgi:hypothetical protein